MENAEERSGGRARVQWKTTDGSRDQWKEEGTWLTPRKRKRRRQRRRFFQEDRKASDGPSTWRFTANPIASYSATTVTITTTHVTYNVHTLDDVWEETIHCRALGASRCIHNDRFVTTRPLHPLRKPRRLQAWPIDWSIADTDCFLEGRGRRRIGERSGLRK